MLIRARNANNHIEDDLSSLFIHSEVATHEGHQLVSPPLEAYHESARGSEIELLLDALEGHTLGGGLTPSDPAGVGHHQDERDGVGNDAS